ncbi:protein draper-like [Ostrea edulis]|uniref:protein draper-like n=1 Tax=Ostrea edulis TaxID=37623 RepID=UPI0024AFEFF6|nr:protein draper-like [Ostrea edulis]
MELQQGMIFHLMILYLFLTQGCGKMCDERCCLNYYKHRNGSCVECPLGTYGVNCSETCVRGYYGKLCLSECECSVHKCDKKYGCLVDRVNEPQDDKRVWTDVGYTLVGSFTTLGIVGLMICLKSWCSKRSVSSQDTNQNDITHPENHEENPYEIHRNSSSSESDDVVPGQATNSDDYTDLRFSRMEPEQCTTSRMEDDTKPQLPSNKTIPENSHHDEDKSDAGENNGGKYSHLSRQSTYNVLSFPRYHPEKLLCLGLADFSSMIEQYPDELVGEYDSIDMNHNKESPQEMEKIQSEEEAVRQSLIDETVNQ